jgi:CelD/BcsL family acetyltransferase involved in cellulose biosynthesis
MTTDCEERLEIVTTIERAEEIAGAWTDIWQDAQALIFQNHAWVIGWWKGTEPAHRTLQIVLAWRGERLDAVLPLVKQRRRGLWMLEWVARDFSDYCDAIVRPGVDPAVLRRMWRLLWSSGGFDVVQLNRFLPTAAGRVLLGDDSELRPHTRDELSLRVVGPWAGSQAWFDQQTKKLRQNYRRGVKVMSENAAYRFRLLGEGEPLVPVLERLAELKRLWLARNGLEAPLFDERSQALAAFTQVLAANGMLRIFVLERDGVIIAISLNFVQNGSMMAYLTSYDPEYERASPGMVLMVDYIKWSIDQGVALVDFLCGSEEFKGRFASESVTLESYVAARTYRGRAALIADRIVHRLKALRARSSLQTMRRLIRPRTSPAPARRQVSSASGAPIS